MFELLNHFWFFLLVLLLGGIFGLVIPVFECLVDLLLKLGKIPVGFLILNGGFKMSIYFWFYDSGLLGVNKKGQLIIQLMNKF